MPFYNIYQGKRVLVTGHTGFKGSWLALWLKELGADVYGVALPARTAQDNFVVCGLEKRMTHYVCDIRERGELAAIFAATRPEIVFHLAAQPIVKQSYDDPADTYATNVLGTVHVLEAIRQTPGIAAAVLITSDKCYKNVEWEWGYRETDELGGLDPYGASKACAELAIQSYRASFFAGAGTPIIASVRAGNVIGGGDWSQNRIVPDIVRALIDGMPVELRQPGATRPWQFVLEPLSGYLWLAAKLVAEGDLGSGWNFGPESGAIFTVRALTEKLIAAWGSGSIRDLAINSQFHEAVILGLDIAKARHRLGWRPTLGIDDTVAYTARWYQAWRDQGDMLAVAQDQIRAYTATAQANGIAWVQA